MTAKNAAKSFSVNKERNRMSSVRLAPALPMINASTVPEPRQPGGCKLKTAPVRPVVAARPAEYVCSEDLFY
ncbi:hypothetical protein LL01C2_29010 [Escherichia coli]